MKRLLLILLSVIIVSCQEVNKPPVCFITSPDNNSYFQLGDTISINIFANDPDGDINEIILNFNGLSLAVLKSEPFHYSLISESYQPGNHTIEATALDNVGLEAKDEIQIILTPSIPGVRTGAVDSITSGSALVKGEVTSTGGVEIIARGICWNTLSNPTVSGNHTMEESGTGMFQSKITDLLCGTNYYVRAYATNNLGTAYGEQVNFTTGACYDLPIVLTGIVSEITDYTAICSGEVTHNGGAHIVDKGVCWSTSEMPTIADSKSSDGIGDGAFSGSLTNMEPFTTYYVRAYASNAVGTAYGEQVEFQTSSVTDYDGNVYRAVLIGKQVWIRRNLATTHYADGTPIPLVEDSASWGALDESSKAYCWHSNDPANRDVYGALYTMRAALNGDVGVNPGPRGAQGACPDGWHVSSDSEWIELEVFLGMDTAVIQDWGDRGTTEGGKLKEAGTAHWNEPNLGATNETGFTAIPSDIRFPEGEFGEMGGSTSMWTPSYDGATGYSRHLVGENARINRVTDPNMWGFSVRCIRD